MAKIEMDLSEYERMMEVKTLLEQSLNNERDLKKEIQKLTDEKLKALEDAKMKVIKINRREVVEYPVQKRDSKTILSTVLLRLNPAMNLHNLPDINLDDITDIFFEKSKIINENFNDEIITTGLDEITSELRESIKKELSEDYDETLKKANIDKKNVKKLEEELKLSNTSYEYLLEENEKLNNDKTELIKQKNKLNIENSKNSKFLENIIESLDDFNIFNYKRKIKNVLYFIK